MARRITPAVRGEVRVGRARKSARAPEVRHLFQLIRMKERDVVVGRVCDAPKPFTPLACQSAGIASREVDQVLIRPVGVSLVLSARRDKRVAQ